ncbi:MAG: hypothetical protein FD178_3690 [Ignavibacteria bacterium]|nr:MAG: hypothetical protein FD178_3690 [Ignavibacteria bacterium]
MEYKKTLSYIRQLISMYSSLVLSYYSATVFITYFLSRESFVESVMPVAFESSVIWSFFLIIPLFITLNLATLIRYIQPYKFRQSFVFLSLFPLNFI